MKEMRLLKILLLLLVLGCSIATASSHAATPLALVSQSQSEVSVTAADPAAVRELISRLSDEQVRALLIERMDLVAKESADSREKLSITTFLQNSVQGIPLLVREAVRRIPMLKREVEAWRAMGKSFGDNSWMLVLTVLAFAIAAGLIAERGGTKLISPLLIRFEHRWAGPELKPLLLVFTARAALMITGIFIFIIVSYTVVELLLSGTALDFNLKAIDTMLILARIVGGTAALVLAPKDGRRRMVNMDDDTAIRVHRHAVAAALLVGFTGLAAYVSASHGIERGQTRLGFWLNLAINIYYILIAWHARYGIPSLLLLPNEENTPLQRRVAANYPLYIIAVVILTWFLVEALASNGFYDLIGQGRHYLFMVLLICAPAMDSVVRAFASHFIPPMQGEGQLAEQAYQSTKQAYIRIGRVVLVAFVLNWVMEIWDLDIVDIASAGLSSQLVIRLVDTLWLLLSGYLIWELSTLWINRKLAAEQTAAGINPEEQEIGGEGGGAGSSRLSTVLPLLRWGAQTLVAATTVLLALGQLGIDTTPLLAGAGVIGLAIGFGAQKLVTDFVSGIFFLIDDAFRAGEYVEVESIVGTVEKISLRSLQLRHHRGAVHTIPYGEIPKITNYSRDWVIMKLPFTVPFDTDLQKVKKIFKKIGQEVMEVPELAQDLLQPFKSQGAIEVDDVGIVIRGKFMAKPGKQFTLRKEIYQRVQKAFDENGLQFARKEVRVSLGGVATGPLSDDDKQMIAAAAAESAENPPKPAA